MSIMLGNCILTMLEPLSIVETIGTIPIVKKMACSVRRKRALLDLQTHSRPVGRPS